MLHNDSSSLELSVLGVGSGVFGALVGVKSLSVVVEYMLHSVPDLLSSRLYWTVGLKMVSVVGTWFSPPKVTAGYRSPNSRGSSHAGRWSQYAARGLRTGAVPG